MLEAARPRSIRWSLGDVRAPAAIVVIIVLLMIIGVMYVGGVELLAAVTAVFWLAAIAYRWPLPIVGLAVLQSTEFFKFFPSNAFLSISLGPGILLNLLDLLVIVSIPFGLQRLATRGEKPLFRAQVVFLIGVIAVSAVIGFTTGDATANGVTGLFRLVGYYMMYFVLVAAIDTRRKLDGWIVFILVAMAFSCVLQIIEAVSGHRLSAGESTTFLTQMGEKGTVGISGQGAVAYLWNRGTPLALLGVMLSLGVVVDVKPMRMRYVWLSGLGFISFLLAFVRQWFIYLLMGTLGALLTQRTGKTRAVLIGIAVAALVVVVLAIASPFLTASFGASFLDAWLGRAATLLSFETEGTHISRIETMSRQWHIFLESPVFGQGQGAGALAEFRLTAGDVGFTNTLVQTGLLGLATVVVLWASFLSASLRLKNVLGAGLWRGYAVGLVGFWTAILFGFLYGQDHFGSPESVFVIVSALAILDRMWTFHGHPDSEELADNPAGTPADDPDRKPVD